MRTLLISAYGCEPNRGSEPGVGWHMVLQLAKNNRLLVITRANNRQVIEESLPSGLRGRVSFFYYDPPRFVRRFKRGERGLYPYYFIWQLGIVPLAKKVVAAHTVDYIMHMTLGSVWMPTFLGGLGIPLIWGPLGGGEGVPPQYLRTLPLRDRLTQGFRWILRATVECNLILRRTARQAVAILARTHETAAVIPKAFRSKVHVILETAIDESVFEFGRPHQHLSTPVRLVTSGRLVPSKNTLAAVEAMAALPQHVDAVLEILGDGPERGRCERLVRELGLEERVSLTGGLSRAEVLKRLSVSDIFIFPSLKECGSWALMEAMAVGLPTICLRWTGMAVVADDSTSILLDPHDPTPLRERISAAIERLVTEDGLAESMGRAGVERIASQFTWDEKGAFLDRLLDVLDCAQSRSRDSM